jgi:hypothetical protein
MFLWGTSVLSIHTYRWYSNPQANVDISSKRGQNDMTRTCYGEKGCYINADAKNTFLDHKHWPRASVADADIETVKSHVYPKYLRFPSVGNF